MLDRNAHQGVFGEVFVRALAAAAGVTVSKSEPDVTGDDFTFGYPGTLSGISFPKIDIQVKSWSKPRRRDGSWLYPMSVAHFNNLAGNHYLLPRFLVLVIVPPTPADYVTGEHHQLVLRQSAHWVSLRELERINPKLRGSTTVNVPERNLLTVQSLLQLLDGAAVDARSV